MTEAEKIQAQIDAKIKEEQNDAVQRQIDAKREEENASTTSSSSEPENNPFQVKTRKRIDEDYKTPDETKNFLEDNPNLQLTGSTEGGDIAIKGGDGFPTVMNDGQIGFLGSGPGQTDGEETKPTDLMSQMQKVREGAVQQAKESESRKDAGDTSGIWGNRPKLPLITELKAEAANTVDMWQDRLGYEPDISVDNAPGALPERPGTPAQQEQDAYNIKNDRWNEIAIPMFEAAPTFRDLGLPEGPWWYNETTGGEVKVNPYIYDEDGVVKLGVTRIPDPEGLALPRVADQAGINIGKTLHAWSQGVFNPKNSSIDQRVPSYADNVGAGEQFWSDFVTLAAPGLYLDKAIRGGAKLAGASAGLNTASRGFRGLTGGSSALAVGVAEAALMDPEGGGLLVTSNSVENIFGIKGEQAENLALILDNIAINGGMDFALRVVGALGGGVKNMGEGLRGFADEAFVRSTATQDAVLTVFKNIDESLATAKDFEVAGKMRNLAVLLESNAETVIKIGQSTGTVPLDTMNAMANSAELYIKATRPRHLIRDPKYVQEEAKKIVDNTLAHVRSLTGSQAIANQQRNTIAGIGDVIDKATTKLMPDPTSLNDATQTLVASNRRRSLDEADEVLAQQKIMDDATAKSDTAVTDDEVIGPLLEENSALRPSNVEELQGTVVETGGKAAADAYTKALQSVEDAYKAIPNDTGIDTIAFAEQLDELVNSFDVADGVQQVKKGKDKGKTITSAGAKDALRRIYRAMADNPDPKLSFSNGTELLDAFALTDVGYNDLYKVKKTVEDLIGRTKDKGVIKELQALKRHITGTRDGGQLQYIMENNPGSDAARLAKEADREYISFINRFRGSTFMQGLSDTFGEFAAGKNTHTPSGQIPRGEPNLIAATGNATANIGNDFGGVGFQQIKQALANPEAIAKFTNAHADLVISEGMRELSSILLSGGKQNADDVLLVMAKHARVLREAGNPLFQKLEDAVVSIKEAQAQYGKQADVARVARDIAAESKKRLDNGVIAKVFQSRYPDVEGMAKATSTPQQKLSSILSGSDAGDAMAEIMAQIDLIEDPLIREATRKSIQGATLKSMRNMAFNPAAPLGEGVNDVRFSSLTKITDETANSSMEGVRQAFPNDPHIADDIQSALDILTDTQAFDRIRMTKVGSDTVPRLNIGKAVGSTTLFGLGYMNSTAAAARNLTAKQIAAMEQLQKATGEQVKNMIFASPKEFSRLLRLVASKADPTVLSRAREQFLRASIANLSIRSRDGKDGDMQQALDMAKAALARVTDNLIDTAQ